MDHNSGEPRLARNARTCPTRELYFLHSQWGKHKSPYRKFRHMSNLFQSAPFQRLLFPDLFCVTTVAGILTYYNEFMVATTTTAALSMSPTAFAGATTAIGLLAGFRLNASYGRYTQGRMAWSDVQTTLRDLARQTMMHVSDRDIQTRMLRLCEAYPVALMFHLNDKGCHYSMKRLSRLGDKQFHDRVQAEFRAELADVYFSASTTTDDNDSADATHSNRTLKDDFERLCRVKDRRGNAPLEILICMGEAIAASRQTLELQPVYVAQLDEKLQRLCKALGTGERIAKTPLPTGFTRHSSRLLFIWSLTLPFALYPLLGPLGTLPASLLTCWAVLSIEDISVQLEEPFDVMPLRQFSNTMYYSIQAIETGYTPPPASPKKPHTSGL
jgi:ion channel-forming bestrophin family protein